MAPSVTAAAKHVTISGTAKHFTVSPALKDLPTPAVSPILDQLAKSFDTTAFLQQATKSFDIAKFVDQLEQLEASLDLATVTPDATKPPPPSDDIAGADVEAGSAWSRLVPEVQLFVVLYVIASILIHGSNIASAHGGKFDVHQLMSDFYAAVEVAATVSGIVFIARRR